MDSEELYSCDSERTLLGILLVDEQSITKVLAMVDTKDFYRVEHRNIFNAIKTLHSDNKAIDIVTVSELLKFEKKLVTSGGREYINDIASDYISSVNWKNYCKVIIKYAKKRQLLMISNSIKDELESGKDVEEVANGVKTNIENILYRSTSNDLVPIYLKSFDVMDKVDKILSGTTHTLGLSTGFNKLDISLSGLVGGRMYLLGARPAMGKSAYAQQIAETVALNHNVLFVSLEMDTEEYTERSMFRRSSINQDLLTRGMVNKEQLFTTLAQTCEDISYLKLDILDNPVCTCTDVENAIINQQSKRGSCDLVIIDYLQLMRPRDKRLFDNKDAVSEISRDIKCLARKYKIPIIALSQLNRTLELRQDKRPVMSDLRESGSLEQDADVVMFLYRDEVYNQDPTTRGTAELIIRKNRQGALSSIDMVFDKSRVTFIER